MRCLNYLAKKVRQTGLFTDVSFDDRLFNAIINLDLANAFNWNTWNISYKDIPKLQLSKFRLIIPRQHSDPNNR